MKKILLVTFLIITLCISACGEKEAAVVTLSVEDVYTAVAITMTAQYTPPTQTNTAAPTSTITASFTPSMSPTIPATPQPVIAYSSTTSSSSASCDSSEFLGDVTIPDGTVLAPGQPFKKTWLLKNNGTCNWTDDYKIAYVSGDKMDGTDTAIDVAVSSGSQLKATLSLVAPTTEGTYTGYWKLKNGEDNSFGIAFYVQIVVSGDAPTLTPTSTATGSTQTPTPTSVSATQTSTTVIIATDTTAPPIATSTTTTTPTPTLTAVSTNTPTATMTEVP